MPTLAGKIAVVTGASSGIGKAIALSMANQGAKIGIVGRKLEKLDAVAGCAGQFSGNISSYKTDLAIDDAIMFLEEKLKREFGSIDILVYSAGVLSVGKTEEASIEDFDRQYRINVRAAYLLTRALLPMIKIRCGQIVFINSSAGVEARAGVGQYAATKHALKAFADSLREEVNEEGIRVLTIYPGRTASPMQKALHKIERKPYVPARLMQPEDVAAVVLNALMLPLTAEVTNIYMRPMCKP